MKFYEKIVFINNKLGDENNYIKIAKDEAKKRKLQFHIVEGKLTLIQNLLDGNWNDSDFLILQPGFSVLPSGDKNIIKSVNYTL